MGALSRRFVLYPYLRAPEGDGDGAGGGAPAGGGETPKTFTQEEVNAMIADTRRKTEAKLGATVNQLKTESEQRVAELNAQIDEIKRKAELDSAPDKERETIELKQQISKYERQLAELNRQAEERGVAAQQATEALNSYRINNSLSEALIKNGALADSLGDAVSAMVRDGKPEFVDDGGEKTLTIEVDGRRFTDLSLAAQTFVEKRPWFAKPPASGAGTRHPNGRVLPQDLSKMPAKDSIAAGLAGK